MDNTDKVLLSGIVLCIVLIGILLIPDNSDNLSPEDTNYDVSIIYNCSGDQIVGEESSYFFTIRNNGKSSISLDILIKANETYLAEQRDVAIGSSPPKNSVEYKYDLTFDVVGFYIFNVTVSKGNFTKTGIFTASINFAYNHSRVHSSRGIHMCPKYNILKGHESKSSLSKLTKESLTMEGDLFKQPVKSSKILSIGYDLNSKKLEIAFHSGRIYQYLNVPESEYKKLMSASSHFTYFQKNIKDHYQWVKKR